MIEIALNDIQKYYGANHVLKGISMEVRQGERVALLGRNGAGKTTLFKIIAGMEGVDGGMRSVRRGSVVGLLDQIPHYPDSSTAYDVLYSVFEELHGIRDRMTELEKRMSQGDVTDELLNRYGRLQQSFEAQNGYSIEDSIHRVVTGLKIGSDLLEKSFNLLSGGEKTRVMLGRLILRNPDVILLDEPTNHLDLSSVEWLEEYLGEYGGTVVIISHDRYFLDRVVRRIVEIVDGKEELYEGNYSFYLQEKEARYQQQLERFEQQQRKIRQLETAAKRMHEWAVQADSGAMHRRAFSIEKRIERMEKVEKPGSERRLDTQFGELRFSGKDVIVARGLTKAYGEKVLFRHADFMVQRGESVAVLGRNGCGKSTLLKLILGEEKPDEGSAKVGESIRFAYLPQVVSFEEPALSILDTVRNVLRISEGEARGLLARYKFKAGDIHKSVGGLSGGEKSRLRLCLLMQEDVNLLLLDEPTNHLDITSREWLEEALSEFGGTIVFVSHDRYFINRFATRICELEEGRLSDYHGDYEFYKLHRQEALRQKEGAAREKAVAGQTPRSKPAGPENTNKTEVELRKLEERIQLLEGRLAGIDREMQASAADYAALQELDRERSEVSRQIEGLYEQWSLLSEES